VTAPRKPSAAPVVARRLIAWLAKWKPVGEALRVGDRVVVRGGGWLGTISEKYPHGGATVIYDHCGTGGGGAAAVGCMHKPTGEHVPRRVVVEIEAARAKWSAARGCCKHDTAVTRILDAYFASIGRPERKPRKYRAWPVKRVTPAGREAARHGAR
jgi:hypothetical protein